MKHSRQFSFSVAEYFKELRATGGNALFADVAATSSSTASVAVGGTYSGSLEVVGDVDWIQVTLEAGQSYRVTLAGDGASGVSDTYLQVFAPGSTSRTSGTLVARNDDVAASSGDYSSAVVFTATQSGIYYIDAGSYNNASSGNYLVGVSVSAPSGNSAPWTLDQIANQLTNGFWGGARQSFNLGADGALTVNLTALDATYKGYARAALALWADATGIIFTETSGSAELTFTQQPGGAWSSSTTSGTTILNSTVNVQSRWAGADYSLQTFIHEIGHSLGLGHAGNYNGSATYGVDNLYANDSWQATVMSYFDQNDNTYVNADFAYLKTPMLADIIAIRSLYGSTAMTRTGDTVYGYNTNAGPTFNSSVIDGIGTAYAVTIIDDGGNDTIDLSGSSDNNRIDLNPLAGSNTGGLLGNLFIAPNTVIENAIGGSGSDVLIGNDVANTLTGGNGNDDLTGGGGDDRAVFSGAFANYQISTLSGVTTVIGLNGTDTLQSIEYLVFSDQTFLLGSGPVISPADTTAPALQSTSPVDEAGSVAVSANLVLTYNEALVAGDGQITISAIGGAVFASYSASSPEVTFAGNTITINPGSNLAGSTGYYVTMTAGFATDAARNGVAAINDPDSFDFVTASIYTTINGTSASNTLRGTAAADHIFGLGGHDVITGAAGNDWIEGGTGDDKIEGGLGADLLNGGIGRDRFIFRTTSESGPGASADTIQDFLRGSDLIDLRSIDANSNVRFDQAFTFIASAAFSGSAGQLRLIGGVVFGDTNGDRVADFQINVTADAALTSSNFLL